MKKENWLIAGILLILVIFMSSLEHKSQTKEEVLAIPDSVYEYIILKLGDEATDEQIISYYDNHRIECDQIELENMN